MKKYITITGELLQGDSPTQIIQSMKDSSKFEQEKSIDCFMIDFAERYWNFHGTQLSTISHQQFISDLIAHGYLK